MANNLIIFFLSSLALIFSRSSQAYQFIVGGKDGWVLSPSEIYSQWAGRSRFSVNDTLLFRYQKGSDSVLVVSKDDYDNCKTGNPIHKLDNGNSVFKLDRSGPFYFITGTKENCDKGQKLVTVVLAVRSPPTPPTATAPSPNGLSSPAPVISPSSPPSEASPFSPISSPSQSPSPENQVYATPPSASSPEANPSPPSTTTTPGTNVPGAGNTPAGGNSSAGPSSFAAPACSPKVVLVLAVSIVLSLSSGGFVISP